MGILEFFRRVRRTDHGKWGEKVAAKMLKDKGFRILGERVRFGSREELDIVARDGNVLVFVEVKTRQNEDFGRPVSAVDRKKQKLLSRAAVRYLKKLKNPRVYFRFDVVEVIGSPGGDNPEVRHIRNAFNLHKSYVLM